VKENTRNSGAGRSSMGLMQVRLFEKIIAVGRLDRDVKHIAAA
jgi:hypothetical protein